MCIYELTPWVRWCGTSPPNRNPVLDSCMPLRACEHESLACAALRASMAAISFFSAFSRSSSTASTFALRSLTRASLSRQSLSACSNSRFQDRDFNVTALPRDAEQRSCAARRNASTSHFAICASLFKVARLLLRLAIPPSHAPAHISACQVAVDMSISISLIELLCFSSNALPYEEPLRWRLEH